jgi:hypothetical protein
MVTIMSINADLQIRFWSLDILEQESAGLQIGSCIISVIGRLIIPTIERFYPLRTSGYTFLS